MAAFQQWFDLSDRLLTCGYEIFGTAKIPSAKQDTDDSKIVTATLVARTLSNMRGVLLLARERRVVEARILTRCCIENTIWMTRLTNEGADFLNQMEVHEIWGRQAQGRLLFEDTYAREDLPPEMRPVNGDNGDVRVKRINGRLGGRPRTAGSAAQGRAKTSH